MSLFCQVKISGKDAWNEKNTNHYFVADISDSLISQVIQPGKFKNWNFKDINFTDTLLFEKSNADWFTFPFQIDSGTTVENFQNEKFYVELQDGALRRTAFSSGLKNYFYTSPQVIVPEEIDFGQVYNFSNSCLLETDTILTISSFDSVLYVFEQDNYINPIAFGNFTMFDGELLSALLIEYKTFRQKKLAYHDLNIGWVYQDLNFTDTIINYRWFIPNFGAIPAFINKENGQYKLFYAQDKPFITEMRDYNKLDILVYPNPFKEILNIKSDLKNKTIEIVDLSGRKMFSQYSFEFEEIVNLSQLNQGVYLLRIIDINETKTIKLIKQ